DRAAFPAALPPGLLDLHFGFDSDVSVAGSHPDAAGIRARYLDAAGKPASPRLVPGRVGQAIALRGDGDHIETDWPGFAGELPRSVSFWSRIEPGTDLSHLPSIAGWGDPWAPLGKWNVTIANQNRRDPVVARISLGIIAYKGSTPLADGRWHHCVAVFSGNLTATGEPALEIFIDGRRETLTRMEFGKVAEDSSAADTVTASRSAKPLRIGVSIEERPGSFPGVIDELRIHAGALSQEAVEELFRQGN
ncbi:MAG TPA: LamG-like jellyroll fold domain-containing protein, partial [Verrucomicrobiae bacterium]|nr:LamG-like jellyroll fold domain-containing protein [Verrucomicrobiae bacterium]